MNTKSIDLIKKIVFPLLALGLLYWAFTKIDMVKLVESLKSANYFWVGVAFVAGVASHLVRAIRWKMLVDPMGYNVRIRTSFYAVMTGYLVNIVTPRVGEVARCAMFHKTDKVPIDKLIGTVVTERIFDMIVMMLMVLAVVWLQFELIGDFMANIFDENNGSATLIKIGLALAIGAFGIMGYMFIRKMRKPEDQSPLVRKIFDFINGLLEGLKSITKVKNPLLFIFYTLLIWFLYFTMTYLVFFTLDGTSHLGIDAALTTLIMGTIAVIIPAPGGFGSFHYFVPLGLKLFNIDVDTAMAYATISHTTQMVMIAIVGGICVFLAGRENKNAAANDSL